MKRILLRICLLAALLPLLACARIVTDPWPPDGAGAADQSREVAPDGPGPEESGRNEPCGGLCPKGFKCQGELCWNEAGGNCGFFPPERDLEGELCKVSSGTYFIGCDEGQDCPDACDGHCPACPKTSRPRKGVTFGNHFFLDRFEVTNRRYRTFLQANPAVAAPSCAGLQDIWDSKSRTVPETLLDHPVVCVTANEASTFCTWAGKRLPYESEWEAGARGNAAWIYPWGDCFRTDAAQCLHEHLMGGGYDPLYHCKNWYPSGTCPDSPANSCEETAPEILPDGEPSLSVDCAWGLAHMAGNVSEWSAGRWVNDFQSASTAGCDAATMACEAKEGDARTVRGGGFKDDMEGISGWARQMKTPLTKSREIGFRCLFETE